MAEVMELTPREIAIASGEEPDQEDLLRSVAGDAVKDDGEEGGKDAPDISFPSDGEEKKDQEAPAGEAAEESAEETESWVDDQSRQLAESYGMSAEELAEFKSPEEFARAAVFLDKHLISLAPKAAVQPPAEVPAGKPAEQPPVGKFDLDVQKFIDADYDEHTIELVKAHKALAEEHSQLQQSVGQFRQQVEADQQRATLNNFHDVVDTMEEDLFGRSLTSGSDGSDRLVVKLSEAHESARQKLYETMDALAAGIAAKAAQSGRPAELPPASVLIHRAKQVAFGEELRKRSIREFQEKVAAQSKRRRPAAGRSRPASAPPKAQDGNRDEVADIADHPEVVKLWNKFQEENGEK